MRKKLKNKWIKKSHGDVRRLVKFAWLPKMTVNGYVIWLEYYERRERSWGWGFHDVINIELPAKFRLLWADTYKSGAPIKTRTERRGSAYDMTTWNHTITGRKKK